MLVPHEDVSGEEGLGHSRLAEMQAGCNSSLVQTVFVWSLRGDSCAKSGQETQRTKENTGKQETPRSGVHRLLASQLILTSVLRRGLHWLARRVMYARLRADRANMKPMDSVCRPA